MFFTSHILEEKKIRKWCGEIRETLKGYPCLGWKILIIKVDICPIHVVTFTLISILATDYIQKRTHWTYFMQILSNYNTKSLYHIENSLIMALKSDIFHSYTCEINISDIWLQFEKLKKLRQMALSYRNIKNKC